MEWQRKKGEKMRKLEKRGGRRERREKGRYDRGGKG